MKSVEKWDKVDEVLNRGVEKIYPSKEALEKKLRSGDKLKLYLGVDPSGADLHLGHAAVLNKIRQFQQLGHEVIFLIGDFTGMIGDPSGKTEARQMQTPEEVKKNAQQYKQQAAKIVDFTGENAAKLKYNSDWLAKLNLLEFLGIAKLITIPQLLKRGMFQQRLKMDKDIFLLEFLYPVMQGYDSVAMEVDLELGGSDQLFNMLVGRDLLKKIKGKEKFVLTMKLLTIGDKKMGKTEGNAIPISAPPAELYGQIMSLPDSVIVPCFELTTQLPMTEVEQIKQQLARENTNAMQLKKKLAWTLVKQYNDEKAAGRAQEIFAKKYQPTKQGRRDVERLSEVAEKISVPRKVALVDLIIQQKAVTSRGYAKRLIKQGAVRVNGKKIVDMNYEYKPEKSDIIEVGKHKVFKVA